MGALQVEAQYLHCFAHPTYICLILHTYVHIYIYIMTIYKKYNYICMQVEATVSALLCSTYSPIAAAGWGGEEGGVRGRRVPGEAGRRGVCSEVTCAAALLMRRLAALRVCQASRTFSKVLHSQKYSQYGILQSKWRIRSVSNLKKIRAPRHPSGGTAGLFSRIKKVAPPRF